LSRLLKLVCVLAALVLGAGALASGAYASHSACGNLLRGPRAAAEPRDAPDDDGHGNSASASARCEVELSWHTVAPSANSVHRPSFDATDPASYDWAAYDP